MQCKGLCDGCKLLRPAEEQEAIWFCQVRRPLEVAPPNFRPYISMYALNELYIQ